MDCPHCAAPLVAETYEGVTIDRCPSCSGTWLDAGELTHIVETREVAIPTDVVRETLALATAGISPEERRTLICCPKCQGPMTAVNYDHTSGVIIDRCPLGHGNWLDATELEKVQAHREHWDVQAQHLESDWLDFAQSVLRQRDRVEDEARMRDMRPARYVVNRLLRRLTGG